MIIKCPSVCVTYVVVFFLSFYIAMICCCTVHVSVRVNVMRCFVWVCACVSVFCVHFEKYVMLKFCACQNVFSFFCSFHSKNWNTNDKTTNSNGLKSDGILHLHAIILCSVCFFSCISSVRYIFIYFFVTFFRCFYAICIFWIN